MDFGPGARETAQNYVAYMAQMSGELRWFGEHPAALMTPPPRSTSPPARSLSPASRTQAILQGQKELMEMVKDIPETCYELSLIDLVEKKPAQEERRDGECPIDEKASLERSESRKMVPNGSQSYLNGKAHQMGMTKSMENGLLLKLVFPGSSLGSKQRQKSSRSLTVSRCSKVSPRPSYSDESAKGLDVDWLKKISASNKVKHEILEVDSVSVKNISSSRSGSSSRNNSTKNGRNRR
ncbi:hypothetical protein SAY86_009333 [Trapa natans]|uniref:Uncharacterized protein n=1 Tax=Trapa natans TaxID=22666 RepID=A0AAN7L1H1_TRANT|nr:hypothetical protein SAY86_009333 [Trapa natans]